MFKYFEEIVCLLPENTRNELERLKTYKEDNTYHPESSVFEHIKIVTNRLIQTGDIDLIISAVYHDIGKLIAAEQTLIKSGKFRAFGHDKISGKFVLNDKDFIESIGGNIKNVHEIVVNHMRIGLINEMRKEKALIMKSLPTYEKLLLFSQADNMLNDFEYNN